MCGACDDATDGFTGPPSVREERRRAAQRHRALPKPAGVLAPRNLLGRFNAGATAAGGADERDPAQGDENYEAEQGEGDGGDGGGGGDGGFRGTGRFFWTDANGNNSPALCAPSAGFRSPPSLKISLPALVLRTWPSRGSRGRPSGRLRRRRGHAPRSSPNETANRWWPGAMPGGEPVRGPILVQTQTH